MGEIQDPQFLRFLGKFGGETLATFVVEDLLVIDLIHRVLPSLTYDQVQALLRELKAEGRTKNVGKTSAALWYPNDLAK